jgi:pyruvate,water dikinase
VVEPGLIIKLDSPSLPAVEQVGGKAQNLMRLHQYGLAVPPGFCLTCAAYERHVNERVSGGAVHSALKELQKAKKSDRNKILTGIRRQILAPAIDPRLAEGLLKYYAALKAPLMAILCRAI